MTTPANKRILLVDDNPAIHDDFRKILLGTQNQNAGLADMESVLFGDATPQITPSASFDLESAYQGQEALEKVRESLAAQTPYAVAFVDIRMPPGWDGVETIEHIWDVDPALQIVVCTAYSDYSWEKMAARLGVNENLVILKKPFDNMEVMQLAHALTRKWLVTQQAQIRMEELDRRVAEATADLRRSEEQLRQVQKMEAVGQLAAGIAHDFNNALTIIQGHASLQLSAGGLSQDAADSMRQIALAAERSANLTRQLLAFSRKQVMRPEVLELGSLVTDLTEMLRRLVGEPVNFRTDLPANMPPVFADRTSIEQILMNLTLNARDAMPNGGQIIISTAHEKITDTSRHPEAAAGDFVRLTVADTGTGIDEETRKHIFEPFFTTKEVNKGSGMGLATVYGITKQHDGWVEVDTEVGKGTSFSVFFPVTQKLAENGRLPAFAPDNSDHAHTIFLVEDDEAVRSLVKEILECNEYKVIEAESGDAALEVWPQHENEIDLLLTDMVMPGSTNGLELAKHLLGEKPDLKVIYTSGYSRDLFGSDVKLQDGVNYLPKPYLSGKLTSMLEHALAPAPVA